MKRYNINVYNGWPMIFDLSICFIYAAILPLYLLAFTPLIIIFIKNQRVYYLLWLICAIISAIIVAIVLLRLLANRFYYDEKNEEIILKLIHQEPKRIPIRDIALVSRKVNANKEKGPVTHYGKNGAYERKTYGVSDAEGRDYFYIKDDPILFQFFENLKINVKRKEN